MRDRAKQLVLAGLDRALAARGLEGTDLALAREEALDWARMRARAVLGRHGIAGGAGVLVTRPGRAELRPLEVAVAGPGEVTVELLVTAVSPGTERAQWLRLPNARPALPFAPGYSGAGRVLAAGRDVSAVERGALVAVARARHASVATVPAAWVTPVPDGVAVEDAALVYLAIIAGYGVRRALDAVAPAAPLCVIGAGTIGALAQRLATLEGYAPVTVVAATRRAEDAALRAGAARFVTAGEDLAEIAAAVVIEATGDPAALRGAVAAARPGATVVLLGSPRGVAREFPLQEIRRKGLRLVGAHISALATEAKRAGGDPFGPLAERFLAALAAGLLDVADLRGEACDPREVTRVYRRLAAGEIRAAQLDWTRLPRRERLRRNPLAVPAAVRGGAAALPVEPVAPAPAPAPASRAATLRFAMVGCGDIGLTNARAVAAAANADVAVCFDSEPALARAAAQRCGGSVAQTLDEALDPARADAVFLSVPHDLHAPLAVRAARAGLHVVVEKPLSSEMAGAEEAVAAASAAGVALSVCLSFRYDATVRAARRLAAAGALGPLRGATVVFHADKPPSYWAGGFSGRATSGWRESRSRAGGGVLIMNLVHYIDLIRHVACVEPAWVSAIARTDDGAEVEDAVALSVGFAGGAIGALSASASTRGAPRNRFELWGEAGTLRLEPDPAVYTERALDGVPAGRWTAIAHDGAGDDRRIFVERFAAAVLAGRAPEIGPQDGLAAQAFVAAAYRSIEEGRPVTIDAPGRRGS